MTREPDLPDFSAVRNLLLEVAQEPTLDAVIQRMVEGICAARPYVVRACIWLVDDQEPELVLAASARKNRDESGPEWTHDSGDFRRVPFTEPLIGQVVETADPRLAAGEEDWPGGLPDWARREGISLSVAQAIVFRGKALGVLAVFAGAAQGQESVVEEALIWLRIFADHGAAAIANAQAFQEIERLRRQLELENEYLREEVHAAHGFGEILGRSEAMQKCLGQIELVAPTQASVLITGESGTGKELIARAIHSHSTRKEHPLIRVNCAAIPRELFESEFFGHVRGAFTGALRDRRGRFQLADQGTLFLDEVSETPLAMQGKLLRVLQEGTFERVGEEVTRKADVRIITATNRNLREAMERGRFREDLFFRISVFPIEVVPLRERPEDIPVLAQHFLRLAARQMGGDEPRLRRRHAQELQGYSWPGNVRELQNVVQRAVITARSGRLQFDLPPQTSPSRRASTPAPPPQEGDEVLSDRELKDLERQNLLAALGQTGWKVSGSGGAAELLGVRPTTLASRLRALGLQRPAGIPRHRSGGGRAAADR